MRQPKKKSSKKVPILLASLAGMYGLAGKDEISGLLWFIAFFAFVFCRLIDSCNEVPVSSRLPVSDDEWLLTNKRSEREPKPFSSFGDPIVNIDGTPMIGGFDLYGNIYGITRHDDCWHGIGE